VCPGRDVKRDGSVFLNQKLEPSLLSSSLAIEVPASVLSDEDAPVEIVEFEEGLQCRIIGLEDLIIDRLNACKYWKSEIDCEMVELLLKRYTKELDWLYLEKKAAKPENNTLSELLELRKEF